MRGGASGLFAVVPSLLAVGTLLAAGAARGQAVSASFDYAMPERFAIPIEGFGYAAESGEVYTTSPISPSSWLVYFDACASSGPIASYEWRIDGQLVAAADQLGASEPQDDQEHGKAAQHQRHPRAPTPVPSLGQTQVDKVGQRSQEQ